MKKEKSLSQLFELARREAQQITVGEIESLTASGQTSPLAAKAVFKPRRILRMFNPTKILIMTTFIVIITTLVLLLNPFGRKTEDIRHETLDVRQKTEDGRQKTEDGKTVRREDGRRKEESMAKVNGEKRAVIPAKLGEVIQNDTVLEGQILRLSKVELANLGFLFDQEGYYYLNRLPDGSKLNFWSWQGPQGGSFGLGSGGGVNQSNKSVLHDFDFYPVATTTLDGREAYPIELYARQVQESFTFMDDTLVPVLFSQKQLGGYPVEDKLVWFKVSDDFFNRLDPAKVTESRQIYQSALASGCNNKPGNRVRYNYESFFPAIPTIKVRPEVLECLGIKNNAGRISFTFKKEGMVYTCWADSNGFGVETMSVTASKYSIDIADSLTIPLVVVMQTGGYLNQSQLPKDTYGINAEMLVPLQIDNPDATLAVKDMVFWIYPNEKTLNCLPPDIAEPLRKEFAYQKKRLEQEQELRMGGSFGLKGGGLMKDSSASGVSLGRGINLKSNSVEEVTEPVPCVYFTNLCESLPGVESVNLYPNPATDKLNVDLMLQSAKKIRFRVLDLGGRVLTDDGAPQNFAQGGQVKHQLDVSKLRGGLYLLLMTDEEGARLTRRFVKN